MSKLVNTLKLKDADFPEVLRHVKPAVKQLHWIGIAPKDWLNRPKVAIVGSRRVTPYGRNVTEKITSDLAKAGVVIISGLALGIDSIAHTAALKAGGTTIAVMPGGLDKIYPASHRNLAIQIMKQKGGLISEYPEGTTVYKYNFVARNRIVSALADALVITEASIKSGSIHTARFALEQGKTVMAVPGNINSETSAGCNNLIKDGALVVTDAQDIFLGLGLNPSESVAKSASLDSPEEQVIMELISQGISSQEDLALSSRLNAGKLFSALTSLELSGRIRADGQGGWQKI